MPNELLVKEGGQIRFIAASGFSPADAATDWTVGTPTDVTLTMSAIADGAARQSNKADLLAVRAKVWACYAAVDYTLETPTAGQTSDFYWAPSTHATAANGNVAGNSGVDAACPNGAVPSGITLAEFLLMCVYIGALTNTDDAAVINGYVGSLLSPSRWGQMIVVNNGGDAYEADNVEAHVVLNPQIDELQ